MTEEVPFMTLPPDYHTAIGVITVNGALMDQLVDHAIWVVLKMAPDHGKVVTDLLVNTSRKIRFLRDLLNPMFTDEKIKSDFHDIFMKLKSAQANRSKIVHAKWVFKPKDRSVHIEVPSSEENLGAAEPMPLPQLQHYGSEIFRAYTALENFFSNIELKPGTTGRHPWPPRGQMRDFRPK